jgi:hypothetical protein
MARQAIAQRAEARRQHINKEWVRLAKLHYTVDILRQQEQRQESSRDKRQHQPSANPPPPHNYIPPPPPPFENIPYHQPPSPPRNQFFQPPPPQHVTTDPKSPLTSHLQLAPWPTNYRATPPPKYHGNTDPHKFHMCHEATIALAGGEETTFAKSLIISLKDAEANWYSRLPL